MTTSDARTAPARSEHRSATTDHRLVYFFGNGAAEGTREMRDVLGGKGANLAEMTNLGVPVPPGFTIACSVCVDYLRTGAYTPELRAEVEKNVLRLQEATGRAFSDGTNP